MRASTPVVLFLLSLSIGLVGCAVQSAPSSSAEAASAAASQADPAFVRAAVWDDGQAEIAFYQVERTQNQYGRTVAEPQSFLVGTYLVKHDFDPQVQSKVTQATEHREEAFKYALFYEFESGSYQYKRNYVANLARADLRPFKESFTSFDWCSNLYEELAFLPDGQVELLSRSDDYGNTTSTLDYQAGAHPMTSLPVLVRGLDFSETTTHTFQVLTPDGAYVGATATLEGRETIEAAGVPTEAERILVTYAGAAPSLIGERADTEERYWRATENERLLVRVEAASGRYRMNLVEHLRSPYWSENIWGRLAEVQTYP
ncbi:MAG: hypothetical protein AAF970_07620 [Bacteroidota bacterium]